MRLPGIVVLALLGAALGVGCTPSPSQPDADSGPGPGEDGGDAGGIDAGGIVDAGVAGLGLNFASDPGLPADVGGDFAPQILEAAWIELENLRAVGDATMGVGTTEPTLRLEWGDGAVGEDDGGEGEEEDDIRVFFETAPPGIYSYVLADAVSYHLSGTVTIGSVATPFEVDDTPPTPLSISVDLGRFELEANTTGIIALKAELADAVREPRWDEIAPDGMGVLRIEGGSRQIGSVRENLRSAFELDQDDDDD